MSEAPISVVTGANSGIGRAVAIHLASVGHRVYGTVRSRSRAAKLLAMAAAKGVDVHLVELDVAEDESVRTGLAPVLEAEGRVDVLVNNAGIAANGVVEETPISTFREVMNVNLYGALRCLKVVLPAMRAQRSGTIVNISSVMGRFAALAQAPYVASKWALEAVSEELAQEVAAFGIRVAIIEPGVTKSAMFAKNTDSTYPGSDYEPHLRRMFQFYSAGRVGATDPFEVAKVVETAITTDSPRLRYAVSWAGPELMATRAKASDDEWVGLGRIEDDFEYYQAFSDLFEVDIRPA